MRYVMPLVLSTRIDSTVPSFAVSWMSKPVFAPQTVNLALVVIAPKVTECYFVQRVVVVPPLLMCSRVMALPLRLNVTLVPSSSAQIKLTPGFVAVLRQQLTAIDATEPLKATEC